MKRVSMAIGLIMLREEKKSIHFNKVLVFFSLFLSAFVYCIIASSEPLYKKLEYDDIPPAIRNAANTEVTKRAYDSSDYTFAENLDVTKDFETTQSQIYVDDLHSYVWNLVYFGRGTSMLTGVVLLDSGGKILLSYGGREYGLIEIIEKKVGKSFYDWTLEEQHVFYELFLHNSYRDFHYSLPKADDLPLDTLISIGKEYLSEYYHVPQDEIDSYKVQDAYFTGLGYPGDLGEGEGKWILRFVSLNSPRAYEYQVTLSAANGTVYFSTPFPTNP